MSKLNLKLGLGRSVASIKKKPMTNKMIQQKAIEMINNNKELQYNIEEDKQDIYTSYFSGSGPNQHYKINLKQDYDKRFVLGETVQTYK
jgi:oxalate decarboxylase/phosphoglucose isomerase-like protein (cupin superfamily)